MARPRDTTPEESELHTSFWTLMLSPLRERLIRFFHNQAAKVLEISQGTLYRKIFEYGLEPGDGAPARAEAPPRRDGAAH